jgi:hypothetical protein
MKQTRSPYLKSVRTDIVPALSIDGEIYDTKKKTEVLIRGKEKFSIWLDSLTPIIKNINHASYFKLLYWISMNIVYEESKISLNKYDKKEIERVMGVSQAAINRSISFLKKANLLIPIPDTSRLALFYVNPCFLWNGGKNERYKKQRHILKIMNDNNLPDLEKKQSEDIKRYEIATQKIDNYFDFSKVAAARA